MWSGLVFWARNLVILWGYNVSIKRALDGDKHLVQVELGTIQQVQIEDNVGVSKSLELKGHQNG